jgi:hypothetical protein
MLYCWVGEDTEAFILYAVVKIELLKMGDVDVRFVFYDIFISSQRNPKSD